MSIDNPHRVRYVGSCWDPGGEQLLLADVKGNVEGFNVYTERKVGEESIAGKAEGGGGKKGGRGKRREGEEFDGMGKGDEAIAGQMSWR